MLSRCCGTVLSAVRISYNKTACVCYDGTVRLLRHVCFTDCIFDEIAYGRTICFLSDDTVLFSRHSLGSHGLS